MCSFRIALHSWLLLIADSDHLELVAKPNAADAQGNRIAVDLEFDRVLEFETKTKRLVSLFVLIGFVLVSLFTFALPRADCFSTFCRVLSISKFILCSFLPFSCRSRLLSSPAVYTRLLSHYAKMEKLVIAASS